MISKSQLNLMQWWAVLGTVAVALYITPSFSSEPVDLPKMFLLVPVALTLFGFVLNYPRNFFSRGSRLTLAISGLFLLQLTLVLFFSGAPFNQQLFGTFGRNTGFLSYVSLLALFISGIFISNKEFLRKLFGALLVTSAISLIYGYLQYFKMDPIKWNNPYNPIIAFLGNPDFASSFLGMSTLMAVVLILKPGVKLQNRILSGVYILLSVFLIVKSHAQQGVLVFGLGTAIIVSIFLFKNDRINKIFAYCFVTFSGIVGFTVILGIFKIGPLATKLYKYSVRQRGFYWHAALEMMNSKPLTGIGIDSYGDNYLKVRSANAAFYSLPTQSNAAHNVYLDLASNGGYPLFILYILLNISVAWYGLKTIIKLKSFDPYLTAIFAAWAGYQAQSIVSINQLGLAVWGWILGGALIGYSVLVTKDERVSDIGKNTNVRGRKASRKDNVNFTLPVIGLAFGLALTIPPFAADHSNRIAATSRDANKIISSTKSYPEDLGRTLNTANLLAQSKLVPQALELAKHVSEVSPKNYNSWVIISQLTSPDSPEHKNAILRMQELNPHDKTIK